MDNVPSFIVCGLTWWYALTNCF